MVRMFRHCGIRVRSYLPYLAGLIPTAAYVESILDLPFSLVLPTVAVLLILVLGREGFRRHAESFSSIPGAVSAGVVSTVYPALLVSYATRIGSFPNPHWWILLFLVFVFANDTGSYVFGMTVGRYTKKPFPISPAKSLAGYVGGLLAAVGLGALLRYASPLHDDLTWYQTVGLGVSMAIAADLGDLAESAIKRGIGIKDSGAILPGRGGILDSIDSIAFCAPFFYYVVGYLVIWY